jgi:hypothetical protein
VVGSRERRKRAGKERAAVEQLLYLIDHAFEGADEECLLANLRPVGEADFAVVPPSGSRSIRQIVGHIGACKYMYANYAFEDRSMTWEDPAGDLGVSIEDLQSRQLDPEPPMVAVIEWLTEGHRRLRDHVAALDDSDLIAPRWRPEGDPRETRWIVANMVRHDDYHAGEINHLRALIQGDDGWEWESG